MGPILLIAHVGAAILFVGPAAVAASMFPAYAPVTDHDAQPRSRDRRRSVAAAEVLHRICRVYGLLALIVPAAGLVLGLLWGKFSEAWLLVSLCLTVLAGVLYALRIVPGQAQALASLTSRASVTRLAAWVGTFNLLWVAVLALMILQPGAPE